MTIKEVRKLVLEWQITLNIPEWYVHVKWGTKAELGDVEGDLPCSGRNYFSIEELDSLIVLDKHCVDLEATIVHELLHLVMDGHKDIDMIEHYDAMQERAINRITASLMGLKYGRQSSNS